jgi:hypothetical protein
MQKILFFFIISVQIYAQTGIGTTTPDASAKLDVSSTNKGFLPPRIALTALNSASPVTSPASGLLIFNTVSIGTSPNQVRPGYYYWDGVNSTWVRLEDKPDNFGNHTATGNVLLNGNYLSNDGGNEGIRIDNSGNVGIGTSTPAVALDVTGAVNANTLSLYNSTIGTPSLVLRNGDAAASYSDIAQIKMGWSGSAAGKSQYAHFLHTRHNSGTGGNAIDFYLSNGTADNTIATGSTKAMTIESPGNLTVAGKISHADPSGSVSVKASGWVNAGSFVSLDNINATIAASGNRGLCISTGSGSIITYMSGTYGITGGMGGGALNTTITFNTNLSTSIFGWHFGSVGDAATYHMNDTTNNKFYRITIMIGYGFNNNFITIERLL